jgi:hypothetical protein
VTFSCRFDKPYLSGTIPPHLISITAWLGQNGGRNIDKTAAEILDRPDRADHTTDLFVFL